MQAAKSGFSGAARTLFVLAALVIVVAGMRAAEALMVPFLLSGFFAILFAPPFLYLQKKGLPAWLSLLLVVVLIVLVQLVFITIVTRSLGEFSQNLPMYQQRLQELGGEAISMLTAWGIDVPRDKLLQQFDPSTIFTFATNVLGSLGSVLSNSFLIILMVIFMLFEAASMPAKLRYAFGKRSGHMKHIEHFLDNVKKYTTIKAGISFVSALIVFVWLWFLGVDFPLLWAMIAFLFNFVPNIGSIVAAVPPVLLALIQLGPMTAVLTALGFVVTDMVMGNVVEPRFTGKGLGLSILVVFLALIFWGWVFGPVGMLLSVPLTMLIKIALESSEDTRWLAILMGPEKNV